MPPYFWLHFGYNFDYGQRLVCKGFQSVELEKGVFFTYLTCMCVRMRAYVYIYISLK